jgi:hypothetical protein
MSNAQPIRSTLEVQNFHIYFTTAIAHLRTGKHLVFTPGNHLGLPPSIKDPALLNEQGQPC